ncbi:MAG TPA: RidA family protein [Thermoplasmata archaeon]|nr:RidA family protein [Thermoplasmata archaeon]
MNLEHAPTSTAVQVSRRFRPELLLEIEAIASIA